LKMFHRGKRENGVADGARPDDQAAQLQPVQLLRVLAKHHVRKLNGSVTRDLAIS
jgi:hypothetical protein